MRVVNKLSIGAAVLGSVLLAFGATAQAHDDWDHGPRWDHNEDNGWHRGHDRVIERRIVGERPVYIARPVVVTRPVVVERPVFVAPRPVVYGPPIYSYPRPASLNLNFNIPLR